MIVKKFEAKTMREALLMVKGQLGPDAVIIKAKGVKSYYGLSGEKSVEVTAAVTEGSFRNLKIAETKMNDEMLDKFKTIKVKNQKQYVEKSIYKDPEPKVFRATPEMRYIDIIDDQVGEVETTTKAPHTPLVNEDRQLYRAKKRISTAVQEAKQSFINLGGDEKVIKTESALKQESMSLAVTNNNENSTINSLKEEIDRLKNLLSKFQVYHKPFLKVSFQEPSLVFLIT